MTALGSWTHDTAAIGADGLACERQATEDERIEIARELDILACDRLAVRYVIRPLGEERFGFTGTLEADIAQACVVSLDPVPAAISETFSIELAPAGALDKEASEGDRVVSAIPDVEPIEDGRIAAGDLVSAVLSAALDPYPRKDGAAFEWVDPKLAADPAAANPFAALARLKRDT